MRSRACTAVGRFGCEGGETAIATRGRMRAPQWAQRAGQDVFLHEVVSAKFGSGANIVARPIFIGPLAETGGPARAARLRPLRPDGRSLCGLELGSIGDMRLISLLVVSDFRVC